jgi:hypothetical protein
MSVSALRDWGGSRGRKPNHQSPPAEDLPGPPQPSALRVPLFADDEAESLVPVAPEPAPCPATPAVGSAISATNPPSSDAPAMTAPSSGSPGSVPSAAGEPTATEDSGSSEAGPMPMGGPTPGTQAAGEAEPAASPWIIHPFESDPTPPPRPKAPPKAPRPAPRPPALSPAAREILADLPPMGSPGTFRFARGAEAKDAARPARPAVVELELTPVEKARRDAANATDDRARVLSYGWNVRDSGRFPTDDMISRHLNIGYADVVRIADALSDEGLWILTRRTKNRPVAELGIIPAGGRS